MLFAQGACFCGELAFAYRNVSTIQQPYGRPSGPAASRRSVLADSPQE
jgi:hypothetical protein